MVASQSFEPVGPMRLERMGWFQSAGAEAAVVTVSEGSVGLGALVQHQS